MGWNRPQAQVNGYSFEYNGHEVTPYRPTIEDVDQLSFREGVGYGKHIFKISGFNTDLTTNEVVVHLQKTPILHSSRTRVYIQALHQDRYVTSCESRPFELQIEYWEWLSLRYYLQELDLQQSSGCGFSNIRTPLLNARDTYLNTLRGEELTLCGG